MAGMRYSGSIVRRLNKGHVLQSVCRYRVGRCTRARLPSVGDWIVQRQAGAKGGPMKVVGQVEEWVESGIKVCRLKPARVDITDN
jgi:hypothetical protein